MFSIPQMGVVVYFPLEALKKTVRLKISILRTFKEGPKPHHKWCMLAPRVRIEPNNIRYSRDVYFIVNHSIYIPTTQLSENALLLHRNCELEPWTIVPHVSAKTTTTQSPAHKFDICPDKKFWLTSRAVVVQMRSNCDICFTWHRDPKDPHRIHHLVQTMRLDVYADYQPIGSALEVSVHAVHNLEHRICVRCRSLQL